MDDLNRQSYEYNGPVVIVSCPLSPALFPTSNDSVRFFSGNIYEICRVAYIQFIFSARHVLRVRVELSQPSYTIGAQPWPFLQNYYLIAGYIVLPFGGIVIDLQ